MLKQIEGSRAVAEAVAMCRPQVICAYPITPQTHIVEGAIRDGEERRAGRRVPERGIGVRRHVGRHRASAAGVRVYTATASQGLLYMSEAVWNAAGLGLPIVMTVANRAIGAPINIWNDHSDAMSQRDAGWLQLYAETSQEALDLHIQAFRIAEELSVPVMVCMDGFLLTHASERADIPDQAQVDAFLPRYEPRQVLDPGEPVSIGAMVGPEAFTEVRYLACERMRQALEVIPAVRTGFAAGFGRDSGGLVRPYQTEDAETVVVALGSVLGTLKDTVDELRADGMKIGVLGITSFRPFPADAVRLALGTHTRHVVVIERALAPGSGGIVTGDIRAALAAWDLRISTVIAGLGGRAVTRNSLRGLLRADDLPPLTFLDLNTGLVEAEVARMSAARRSGPSAENILRDLGITASRIG